MDNEQFSSVRMLTIQKKKKKNARGGRSILGFRIYLFFAQMEQVYLILAFAI